MDQDTIESFTGGQFIFERVRSRIPASEDTFTSAMHPLPASATEQQREGLCLDDDPKGTDDHGPLNSRSIGKTPALCMLIKGMFTPTATPAFRPEQERKDTLSPIYDRLDTKKIWWLLELIPLRHRLQEGPSEYYWSYVSSLLPPLAKLVISALFVPIV